MRAKGLIDEVVLMGRWQRSLSNHAVKENDASMQLMAESLPDLSLYLGDESAYECSRFESVTRSEGLQCPP